MSEYNPLNHSVVQFMRGDRTGVFEVTDFVDALFFGIISEITRIYFNTQQQEWNQYSPCTIPGIYWRGYSWNCACPDDGESGHLAECLALAPHFQFEDVEFDWYKYPGRGMSVNKDWSEKEWRAWFDRCLAAVRSADVEL